MTAMQSSQTSGSLDIAVERSSLDQNPLRVQIDEIQAIQIEFVQSSEFKQALGTDDAALLLSREILTAWPLRLRSKKRPAKHPALLGLRPNRYSQVALRKLFRKMNFLRFLARQKQQQIMQTAPESAANETVLLGLISECKSLLMEAQKIHQHLWQINMPLVAWLLQFFVQPKQLSPEALNALNRRNKRLVCLLRKYRILIKRDEEIYIANGFLRLGKLINRFDYSPGFSFTSYAVKGLLRVWRDGAQAQMFYQEHERMESFQSIDIEEDEAFSEPSPLELALLEHPADCRWSASEFAENLEHNQRLVARIARNCTDRERMILVHRFGLLGTESMTLAEIGQLLGGITDRAVHQQIGKVEERFRYIGLEVLSSAKTGFTKTLSMAQDLEFDPQDNRKRAAFALVRQRIKGMSIDVRRAINETKKLLENNPALLASLDPLSRTILINRLKLKGGKKFTLAQLSHELNFSPLQIQQLQTVALSTILQGESEKTPNQLPSLSD